MLRKEFTTVNMELPANLYRELRQAAKAKGMFAKALVAKYLSDGLKADRESEQRPPQGE